MASSLLEISPSFSSMSAQELLLRDLSHDSPSHGGRDRGHAGGSQDAVLHDLLTSVGEARRGLQASLARHQFKSAVSLIPRIVSSEKTRVNLRGPANSCSCGMSCAVVSRTQPASERGSGWRGLAEPS